jgi:hypothetical protein
MSEMNLEIGMTENAQAADSALLGDGAVLVWNDVVSEGRDKFYEWHDKEHIPERLSIPGFRRGRRYVRSGHSPEWLTMYEAVDLNVVVSPAYLERLNAPTPATVDTLRYFRNTSRAVCRIVHSVGSSSGGHMLALRLDVPSARAEAMKIYLCTDVFPRAAALTSVVACHLYMADQSGSHIDTAESSTREFDVPAWVVLVETTTPEAAESARDLLDARKLESLGVTVRPDGTTYSMEICRLANAPSDI